MGRGKRHKRAIGWRMGGPGKKKKVFRQHVFFWCTSDLGS